MKTLLWKEVRELWQAVVVIVASAATLGIVDVSYNWDKERFVGISFVFCWMAAAAISLLGGANALGRESRDSLVFLTTWPVRRSQVWLAKLAANLAAVGLVIGASFGVCSALLALRGYSPAKAYGQAFDMPTDITVVVFVVLFTVGFMMSGLVRIPMAAAGLAGLALLVFTAVPGALVTSYLPARWGPWLGFSWDSMSPEKQTYCVLATGVVVSAAAIIASVVGFTRAPVLASWRRASVTIGLFFLLSTVIPVAAVLRHSVATRPVLSLASLEEAQVVGDGRAILLVSRSAGRGESGDAWLLSLTSGGPPHLLSRGPVSIRVPSPDGRCLIFVWDVGRSSAGWTWLADLQTGAMQRLPSRGLWDAWLGGDKCWSPRGTYCLLSPQRLICMDRGKPTVVQLPNAPLASGPLPQQVLGWSPDEREAYLTGYIGEQRGQSEGTSAVFAVTIPQGQWREVARLRGQLGWGTVSLDGRWVAGVRRAPAPPAPGGMPGTPAAGDTNEMVLISLADGSVRSLPDLHPQQDGWSPDGRYLWCARGTTTRITQVLNLSGLQVLRTIAGADLGGAFAGVPHFSRRGDRVYFTALFPKGDPRRGDRAIWRANPDGTGVERVLDVRGSWIGEAADGNLVVWRRPLDKGTQPVGEMDGSIVALSPDTGAKRVILKP